MKIKVEITELLQRVIEFEALSPEDAERQMLEKYRNGDVILDADDCVSSEVCVL